jgi:hypothetical protein
MLRRILSCAIALCLLVLSPCFAWGEVGHRVVGRIAASQLTPAARANVARILDVENTTTAVADALADAAEWPDAVARTKDTQTVEWHFIDLGAKANAAKDNVLWASPDTAFARIVKFAATIKAKATDELETRTRQRSRVPRASRGRHSSATPRHHERRSRWQLPLHQVHQGRRRQFRQNEIPLRLGPRDLGGPAGDG